MAGPFPSVDIRHLYASPELRLQTPFRETGKPGHRTAGLWEKNIQSAGKNLRGFEHRPPNFPD